MKYERVLVATDFSTHAGEAARLAARLAPGAKFHLVHVIDAPDVQDYFSLTVIADLRKEREDARATAEARLKAWGREMGLPSFTTAVRIGHAGRAIAEEAASARADLVAIGARGHSRIAELLLGSQARAIMRRVDVDLLVARGVQKANGFHILTATDLHEPARAATLRAASLSSLLGGDLTLMHVIDQDMWRAAATEEGHAGGQHADQAWLDRTLGEMLHKFNEKTTRATAKELVRPGRVVPTLVDAARSEQADLLVVGTHGAGPIARALLGSVAEGTVEHAPCSVLVVRPSAATQQES